MTTLDEAAALARDDRGLAVISTLRADGTIQSSVVNAGLLAAPIDGCAGAGVRHLRPGEAG